MKQNCGLNGRGLKAVFTLSGLLLTSVVFAQNPPPPPGGGPGGMGMGMGMGMGRRPFGPPPMMGFAELPITLLAKELGLSGTQTAKIADIQRRAHENFPGGPGGPGGFGRRGGPPNGGPPNFAAMQKMQKNLKAQIDAVLTPEQRTKLTGLMKETQEIQRLGIPVQTLDKLNLLHSQRASLEELSVKSSASMRKAMQNARDSGNMRDMMQEMMKQRNQMHEQAMQILTESQRRIVDQFFRDHPRGPGMMGMGMGGPGGPGGRGMGRGGPGGPPPPPPGFGQDGPGPDGPPPF